MSPTGTERFLKRLVRIQGSTVLAEHHGAKFRRALDGPGVGLEIPGHESQERGLARSVGAEQSDSLARRQHQVERLEESLFAHRLPDRMQRQQFLGLPIRGLEVDRRGLGGRRVSILGRLQFGSAGGRILDLGLVPGLSTLDALSQPRGVSSHLVGEDRLGRGLGIEELLLASDEIRVVPFRFESTAWEGLRKFDDPVRGVLQKTSIVGDEHHGDVRLLDERLQPKDALEIQMVGRFVEHEHVGIMDQSAGEGEPLAPAARQGRDRSIEIGEAQLREDDRGPGVAIHAVVTVARELRGDGRKRGRIRLEAVILRDIDELGTLAADEFAFVGVLDAHQDLHQGGLPGAIRADQSDAIADHQLNRHILEEDVGWIRLGEMTSGKQIGHGNSKIIFDRPESLLRPPSVRRVGHSRRIPPETRPQGTAIRIASRHLSHWPPDPEVGNRRLRSGLRGRSGVGCWNELV